MGGSFRFSGCAFLKDGGLATAVTLLLELVGLEFWLWLAAEGV